MKFIIGIGNPGKEYEKTRHNIGFRVVDVLRNKRLRGVHLSKPQTFVNRTGDEILKLSEHHVMTPGDLLIVCDDVNLPLGKIRLRAGGSSGGHKGLESVIGVLNTEDFARLRLGVGTERVPKDLAGFVLQDFSKSEEKILGGILKEAAAVCETWAKEGLAAAMDRLSQLESKK